MPGARVLVTDSAGMQSMKDGSHESVGWNATKEQAVGRVGVVRETDEGDGCTRVDVGGSANWFPPDALWVLIGN